MTALGYDGKEFLFKCGFDDRVKAKKAGFFWCPKRKLWYSSHLGNAAKLREFANDKAKAEFDRYLLKITPWTLPLSVSPAAEEKLLPHQLQAIHFSLARNRSYLGLDPGLGKTACAAIIVENTRAKTIYISPPFLLKNIKSEFEKWSPKLKVEFLSEFNPKSVIKKPTDVLIIPDSMLLKPETHQTIDHFFMPTNMMKREKLIIIDEAHRFKNEDAKRTIGIFGDKKKSGAAQKAHRWVFMSGTPMPNRPIELFTILSNAAPETIGFKSKFQYAQRYCGAYQTEHGWDFSGASNLPELARKVIHPHGPFMLRQKKSLLNLPPKIEEVFVLSHETAPLLQEINDNLQKLFPDTEELIRKRLSPGSDDETHIATYRRLSGEEKIAPAAEYINYILGETEENIIVFAYHKSVVAGLKAKLSKYSPIVITGETPVDDRQRLIKEFQTNSSARLIIGNYLAMGVGFTITKATRVIFAEFDYVPGNNDQASDRAHRIGQTESVLVQYLVLDKSIDRRVMEALIRKRKSLAHI